MQEVPYLGAGYHQLLMSIKTKPLLKKPQFIIIQMINGEDGAQRPMQIKQFVIKHPSLWDSSRKVYIRRMVQI